jgi:hypothetical protein
MAKNKITDLRDHLFETLEALKDPDKPMELDRARAISQVAQTIIESAKVEVELVKAINGRDLVTVRPGSMFFGVEGDEKPKQIGKPNGGHLA